MIEGPHVTFVDPRNFNNISGMVGEARRRSQLFLQRGFTAENVLISVRSLPRFWRKPHWNRRSRKRRQLTHPLLCFLYRFPATEAGLQATRILQKEGINVNLYLVGSFIQAAACAETGAAAVTIHVGRVGVSHTALWTI